MFNFLLKFLAPAEVKLALMIKQKKLFISSPFLSSQNVLELLNIIRTVTVFKGV